MSNEIVCRVCHVVKPVTEFNKDNGAKLGVRKICKICDRKRSLENKVKRRMREGEDLFTKKQSEAKQRWRKNNRDRHLANRRLREGKTGMSLAEYREHLKTKRKTKQPIKAEIEAKKSWAHWIKERAPDWWLDEYYQSTGEPWKDHRLSDAEKYRMRYRLDREYNLKERLRRQIRKAQKRDGIGEIIRYGLRNNGKSKVLEQRLGYSIADLKDHIERQFEKKMSWDDYMNGDIHIDHIIPQSQFNTQDDDEWRECWSLSNLRPMWAKDNIAKSNKVLMLV